MKKMVMIGLLLCAVIASAQTKRIPVKFDCACDDPTGAAVATAFRDLLSTSPRYIESSVSSGESADGKRTVYYFGVKIVSLDPSIDKNGRTAALASSIVIGDYRGFINEAVYYCYFENASDCAHNIFSALDENTQPILAKVKEIEKEYAIQQ